MKLTRAEVELAANPPKHGKYHDPSRHDLARELLEAWDCIEAAARELPCDEYAAEDIIRKYLEGRDD